MVKTRQEIENVISRYRRALSALGITAEQVILFGSYATGKAREISDIDLLIVLSESDEPGYRRARKAYGCLWGLTAPAEFVVATQQEIERASRVPASLLNQAVQRGRVIYE